jgi:hypothetical protein
MNDVTLYLESLRMSAILVRVFVGVVSMGVIAIGAMEGVVRICLNAN